MSSINEIDATKLIEKAAEELKGIEAIQPPEWSKFAKTGVSKERVPDREDWWFVRSASVLRAVNNLGPVGVSKLRRKYGGRKNRGHKPDRVFKGSGNILRKIFQQLDTAGLIQTQLKKDRKGRVITPKGVSFLHNLSNQIKKEEKKKGAKEE